MQTELHKHLDISLRISTTLELAQKLGLEGNSTSVEAFRDKIVLRNPVADLNECIERFDLFRKILDRPETLERVAFEVVEDCYLDGTRKVELRFSPAFVCELSQMSWDDALGGFERGMKEALKKYPAMHAGLICIATREYGMDEVDKTVEFYLKNKTRFVALDLAGQEDKYPCRLFERTFQSAKKQGARLTIHAGEASGPQNIWEAIELLGAERIGHGITCVQDPKLMDYLAKNRICLEMCPTSNYLVSAVRDLKTHPLPKALRAGIPVTINTDDPTVFGVNLSHELDVCRREMGLSEAEIQTCMSNASKASFIPTFH